MAKRVVIAGGGLAGLTCAKYLLDAGCEVYLFEGQPFLGGRASTFRDKDGDWVEQGLHLFFGVYSEFKQLLRDIGVNPDDILYWMEELNLQDAKDGAQAEFGINPLRRPFTTFGSVLTNNNYLGVIDKLRLLPLVAPAVLRYTSVKRYFDSMSVTDWWRWTGGSKTVLERLIRPFCRGIQFSEPEQFSAFNFLTWIHHVAYNLKDSLAGTYWGARDQTIFDPLGRYLFQHGATVRTGAQLKEIRYEATGQGVGYVTGFGLEHGEWLTGDIYVAAVPVWALTPLIPDPMSLHPFFADLNKLPVAPAISVQIWFDRKVCQTPQFTLVANSPCAVYQDQSTTAYPYGQGSRISVIVSPADDLLDRTDETLVSLALDSLGRAQPEIATAQVMKAVVLKHAKHLVRPLPRAMSMRPTQATPVPNFFLAGDWTQQEFFGSQEGAVRGGKACAMEIRRALEQGTYRRGESEFEREERKGYVPGRAPESDRTIPLH